MQKWRVQLNDKRVCFFWKISNMQWVISKQKEKKYHFRIHVRNFRAWYEHWYLRLNTLTRHWKIFEIKRLFNEEKREKNDQHFQSFCKVDFFHFWFMIRNIFDLMTIWANTKYLKSKRKMKNERCKFVMRDVKLKTYIFLFSNRNFDDDFSVDWQIEWLTWI